MDLYEIFENFTDGLGIDPEYVGEEKPPSDEDPEKEEGGTPPGGSPPGYRKSQGDWGP